mmetsp:Transcript_13901/g.35589  ORF Transcript_13901/g.35589 Transcript_13901/m.35589 type:complete len:226 (+) Transcript_13901:265-942(+)
MSVKKTVGRAKADDASSSMVMFVSAASLENCCSFPILFSPFSPPRKKDMPSTSSRFDSTLPRRVPFTTSRCPERSVCTMRIISTAFPKVAFSRPPIVSFFRPAASSSVASPRIFASGTMAMKLSQKHQMSPHSRKCAAAPAGQNTRRMFIGSCRMRSFRPSQLLGFPDVDCSESLLLLLVCLVSFLYSSCFPRRSSFFCATRRFVVMIERSALEAVVVRGPSRAL